MTAVRVLATINRNKAIGFLLRLIDRLNSFIAKQGQIGADLVSVDLYVEPVREVGRKTRFILHLERMSRILV